MRIIRNLIGKLQHRRQSADAGGNLRLSGSLIARKISSTGAEATRVVDTPASAAVDKFDADAPIIYSVTGDGPQGERMTIAICQILVERMNELGEHWSAPTKPEGPEQGIDCVSTSGAEGLFIQVTRAIGDETLWQELARSGSVARSAKEEDLADELFRAISHKETIPPVDRKNIVLALDAYLSSGTTIPSVVSVFRSKYGKSIRSLGFRSVWVVGPTTAHTTKLDDD
jgi:hypothetical protein